MAFQSQTYPKIYTRNESNSGSYWTLPLCNKCYDALVVYILIIYYDLFSTIMEHKKMKLKTILLEQDKRWPQF